ncbi:MAG: efflux RND transporter permease subunit [Endomicrobia bacterium]|nr:efflux RND transporter permease subunit [Endomicrobiia bacterium]
MKITEISVRRPVATIVFYTFLLIISIIALFKLPVDMFPQMELPVLIVTTTYPQATALDVEEKVTKIIENAVQSVPGIDKVESRSLENISVVIAQFKWGSNIDEKASDLRDLLEFTKMALPEDVEKPRIIKLDPSMMPVMFLSVSSDRPIKDINYIVDRKIVDEIKKVDGVAGAILRGGEDKEVSILIDPQKLTFYRLTIQQLVSAISQENLEVPIGEVYEGFKKYSIRATAKFSSIEEIKNLIVGNFQNKPIYLYQIADVKDAYKEKTGDVNVNGKDALMIMIRKKSQTNTVYVCSQIREKIESLRKNYPQLKIDIIFDSSEYILEVVENLKETIFVGGILVILTVLFFLGDFIPAFVVVLQIPLSLILAFLFLYLFGYTINLVSLMSLSIAIGMVVDNSIVVVDHILRHISWGKNPKDAAIIATSEVASAISASTLTTIVVFVPLLFVSGLIPLLFKQLAVAVIVTLLCSLAIGLTLSPMLSSQLCSETECQKRGVKFIERIIDKIDAIYEEIILWALSHKKTVIFGFMGIFFISLFIFIFFIGKEFMPKSDEASINIYFETSKGMRFEETYKIGKQVEEKVLSLIPQKYIRSIFIRCGESGARGLAAAFGESEASNAGEIGLFLVDKEFRDISTIQIVEILRNNLKRIPGVIKIQSSAQSSASSTLLGGGGKAVSIELYGNDIEEAIRISNEIKQKLQKIEGIRDITLSLEESSYQIVIKLDREKIKMLGISSGYLIDSLRKTFYGTKVSNYTPPVGSLVDTSYDITVKINKILKEDIKNLKDLPIMLPSGRIISLSNVATFERVLAPNEIKRKDGVRVVKIEADIYGRALNKVRIDIEKMLKTIRLPYGFSTKFGGEIEQQMSAFRDLTLMVFLGILLVYLIMAAQFESFLDPFIIMFSVPFAVVGILLGVFLWGTNFNIMSFVGLLLLVGIVVNNAIVLVDYTNLLRRKGMGLLDAVKEGCKNRLKPILMTAVTTILGTLPLAIKSGSGAEYFSSMGVAIVTGLTFSTFITLIFVPTLYTIIHSRIKK